jgi:hypothetical protein
MPRDFPLLTIGLASEARSTALRLRLTPMGSRRTIMSRSFAAEDAFKAGPVVRGLFSFKAFPLYSEPLRLCAFA